jgi:GT2 family glycosyltransferase
VTRACLDAVGPFDEERYGAGYGEEVDFCMRAARAGFVNAVAADVFVRHVGEVSFGGSGVERRAKAQAAVDALYPEFQQRLRAFIPADPLRMFRRRADLERMRAARARVRITPAAQRHVKLDWPRPGEEFALWMHPGRDRGALAALREALAAPDAPLPELEPRWLFPAS